MSLLRTEALSVRYGGIRALDRLTLDLAAGETLMITGPNGAGKSSLMACIAGHVRPWQGHVVLDGVDISQRTPERIAALGLSMVPEGRHVFGSMSVLENLRVGCGLRRDKAAVRRDLDYCFSVFPVLAQRKQTQAGLLSGGQQQMLVIARALMTAPRLLAIDEPSLGLAPRVTDEVYAALLRLQAERGLTLLIVEQSATRARMVGARMLLLREGRIVLQGQAQELASSDIEAAYFGYEEQAA